MVQHAEWRETIKAERDEVGETVLYPRTRTSLIEREEDNQDFVFYDPCVSEYMYPVSVELPYPHFRYLLT